MAILDALVSQYSLTVDAVETVALMVESADNAWGRRLLDALAFATDERYVVYPVSPYAHLELFAFRPDSLGMPRVDAWSADDVLGKLEEAGFVSRRLVARDESGGSYLSEDRIVTSVQVLRPFALVAVDYRWSAEAERRLMTMGQAYADRWTIVDRSYVVPAGWYLVGEVGDYTGMKVAGVAGMDSDRVDWLFELTGFEASTCTAVCRSCDGWWQASCGSWLFEPDGSDGAGWAFDDAEGVDEMTNTVACPACGTGRVHFWVY